MMEHEYLLRIGLRLFTFGATGLIVARGLYLRLRRRLMWLSPGEKEALVRLRAKAQGRDAALAEFDRAVREARDLIASSADRAGRTRHHPGSPL